jgi:hypothetical protein
MLDTPLGRDLLILCAAVAFGLFAALATGRVTHPERPVWPVRVWLWVLRLNTLSWINRYPESRTTFSRREQFLASFFAWFFIVFAAGAIAFGCSYRAGC